MWLKVLGDSWLTRNRDNIGERDMISPMLEEFDLKPESVLEIGCSTGWRLKKLHDKYGCKVAGIDPSKEAIEIAAKAGITAKIGTADKLPFDDDAFDVVIFGFCLCFIMPEDWPALVAESHRVLRNGGAIIINDFVGMRFYKRVLQWMTLNNEPARYPTYIVHYNWTSLWTAHPGYRLVADRFNMDRAEVVSLIRKDLAPLLRRENE